jgi:hypothetical protein
MPRPMILMRAASDMTIIPERLAEIERILREAAGRSRAQRLRRRGFAVLFGPEPGHVQPFTDDGEMIFETRTPRWAAAQFVVMASSTTLGTADPLKGLDGAPVVYRTREQAEIEARRLNRKPKSLVRMYSAAFPHGATPHVSCE